MVALRSSPPSLRLATLAVGAALLLAPAAADAQEPGPYPGLPPACEVPSTVNSPFVLVLVNSVCFDLADQIRTVQEGKIWQLETGVLELGGAEVQVNALFNADPFITFGITTTTFVPGPTTFAVLYGTPITPGLYSTASSTGGLSLTPGALGSTVDNSLVYPFYISGYGTLAGAPTNLGVDLGTAACVAAVPATSTCNQGTTGSVFGPTPYDNLEALLTYTQTDVGSVASWSGRVDIGMAVVPEPATIGLVFMGLLAIGGVGRLRRRVR